MCPGDLWEDFWQLFWGLRGLGAHICQEDDQAMEIWPDGQGVFWAIALVIFGSESLFLMAFIVIWSKGPKYVKL